jgi:hypothetical protein
LRLGSQQSLLSVFRSGVAKQRILEASDLKARFEPRNSGSRTGNWSQEIEIEARERGKGAVLHTKHTPLLPV